MPFDAADFDWQGRPTPGRSFWDKLSMFLLRFALLLARAALAGVALTFVACAVAIAMGHRPECVIFDPFQACR